MRSSSLAAAFLPQAASQQTWFSTNRSRQRRQQEKDKVQIGNRYAGTSGRGTIKPPSGAGSHRSIRQFRMYNSDGQQLFRADKVLAHRGYASRSECQDLLRYKRVEHYDPENDSWYVITGPKTRIPMEAKLRVDRKNLIAPIPLLLVFHKEKWVLSVTSDPRNRRCLQDFLTPQMIKQGFKQVGRLDYDTSGLLLFSSNGSLTQKLLNPRSKVEKEYVATVEGVVDGPKLAEELAQGVETADGTYKATLVVDDVQHLSPDEGMNIFRELKQNLPHDYNTTDLEHRGHLPLGKSDAPLLSKVRVIVTEGKHRMVRRMLANCGYPVIELCRTRIGDIQIMGDEAASDDIGPGEWRDITADETDWAKSFLPQQKQRKRRNKSTSSRSGSNNNQELRP